MSIVQKRLEVEFIIKEFFWCFCWLLLCLFSFELLCYEHYVSGLSVLLILLDLDGDQ